MAISGENTDFITTLWEKISDFIPEKKKDEAATVFFETVINDDSIDIDKIELAESNPYLWDAYEATKEDDNLEELDLDE